MACSIGSQDCRFAVVTLGINKKTKEKIRFLILFFMEIEI